MMTAPTAFVVMALALIACGSPQERAREGASPMASPAGMTREEAEARTRQQTARFPKIDRIASKLTTWHELQRATDSGAVAAMDPATQVWVFAVAGEFAPGRAPAGVTPPRFPWGVQVYEASTGSPLSAAGGQDGDWPPYFDGLTDLSTPPNGSVGPSKRCEQARQGDAVVIATYQSTVGEVRAWADRGEVKTREGRFPGRSDDESVALCWYDGPVAKSPPASGAAAFDRYVTMVDERGQADWVMAGYRDRLKPEPPKT
jgi:hypothetical protein